MKTKRCAGCGAILQSEDINKQGYIEEEKYSSSNLCRRCFRLKHYNEYNAISMSSADYKKMFASIEKDAFMVFVVDLFDFDNELIKLVNDNSIIVINKKDLLPKSTKDDKLINHFEASKFKKCLVVSSEKNYNIDQLYNLLKEKSKIYFVGNTNAGKSTLINKLIKNYGDREQEITTSYYPATTLDILEVKINDELTIFDTPGLINEHSFLNDLDKKSFKKVVPKKEVKPRTFQLRGDSSIIVEDYLRLDTTDDNSWTFYLANNLNVRINSFKNDKFKDLEMRTFKLKARQDLVVSGLMWLKVTKDTEIKVYLDKKIDVSVRESII